MIAFKSLKGLFVKGKNNDPPLRLKYFQKFPNAGDLFSVAVAKRFLSKNIIPLRHGPVAEDHLILLGSILHWADACSIICGAGFIKKAVVLPEPPKLILCVRGPLTAQLMIDQGITPPPLYADPGALAPEIFPDRKKVRFPIGIIPHRKDADSAWVKNCKKLGYPVISVLSPLDTYFRKLQQCEVIFSSSLHGLIFAHAYGKPALWTEISDRVVGQGFKFLDYYQSAGISAESVPRIRVDADTDPKSVLHLATCINLAQQREIMQDCLQKVKLQLF